jgi:hypothetical protein
MSTFYIFLLSYLFCCVGKFSPFFKKMIWALTAAVTPLPAIISKKKKNLNKSARHLNNESIPMWRIFIAPENPYRSAYSPSSGMSSQGDVKNLHGKNK